MSTNHMAPPAVVIPFGSLLAVKANCVNTNPGVTRQRLGVVPISSNQTLPSKPMVMKIGSEPEAGTAVLLRIAPEVEIWPILPVAPITHILPPGPATISTGRADPGTVNSVMTPAVVMRAILCDDPSQNH